MPSARDTAKALFERNRSHLPKHASADVERAWEDRANREHGAASKWIRTSANDSIGIAIPPMGGLGIILLVLFWLIAVAVVWIHRYLGQNPAGATTFIALILAWAVPQVGIITLLGICLLYRAGGFGDIGPLFFIFLTLPVFAAALPMWRLPWLWFVNACWRHTYVAVLVFASATKGQLQFLVPNEAPRIQQAPESFAWALVLAVVAALLSMLAAKCVSFFADGDGHDGLTGLPRAAYKWLCFLIYGAGTLALGMFVVEQLLTEYSIIAYWT